MTINIVPRTPHFELQPAPPKKHLNPNDQLEKQHITASYLHNLYKKQGDLFIASKENIHPSHETWYDCKTYLSQKWWMLSA